MSVPLFLRPPQYIYRHPSTAILFKVRQGVGLSALHSNQTGHGLVGGSLKQRTSSGRGRQMNLPGHPQVGVRLHFARFG